MGLASNQARVLLLTARQNDLELAMTTLTSRQQLLATKQAELITKKSEAMMRFVNSQSADTDVAFTETAEYAQYESEMKQLEMADTNLTLQLSAMETEHKAIVAELEQDKKLVESNIKNSFNPFK